jgi:hypothetical protein
MSINAAGGLLGRSHRLEESMKQLREHWKWQAVVAPIVFGFALMIVVTSCGDASNPAAPSAAGSARVAAVDGEPTPTPTPDPDPDPTPTPTPTPPQAGEGCTPGYWKAPQHFDSWPAPYLPGQQFSSVFENAFPGLTLLQVLELQGGGLNALGRQTVAALLSAASPDVDYDLTPAEVIAAFNAVFPGGDYETLKNRLDFLNNQGCPLD